MSRASQERLELSVFADALRHFLGLEPIYQSGPRPPTDDAVRFYVVPFAERTERTPKRGSAS